MSKTTGLGKGLNAIFDLENLSNNTRKTFKTTGSIVDIELDKITPNPNQPRKKFEPSALEELSGSIARLGVIQPITVKELEPDKYFIISGERRYRASLLANCKTIPAYIRSTVDETQILEMALVENIQREELGAMEIAVTMQRLVEECSLTQEQLAERIGKKRSTVSNYLRLLKLPVEIQIALNEEAITMGHARALVAVEDKQVQIKLLKRIIDAALSVRQVEELVKSMAEQGDKKVPTAENFEYPHSYTRLIDRLESLMGQSISIKRTAKGNGKIIIGFDSDSDIEQILERLN